MLGITKKLTGLTGILVLLVFLAGCTQTIDSSSEKTLKESEENIRQSLSTQDSIIFDKAARYMRSNMSTEDYRLAVDGFNSEEVVEAALQLEAKNKQEMLDAAQAEVDEYQKMKDVIDGIEILSIYETPRRLMEFDDAGETRVKIKNNSSTNITQLRLNGNITIRFDEEFINNDNEIVPPGDYPFRLDYMAWIDFDEPVKAGETKTAINTIHDITPGASGRPMDSSISFGSHLLSTGKGSPYNINGAPVTEKNQILNDDNIGVYAYASIDENGETDFIMWRENEYIKAVAARDKILNMPSKIRE